MVKFRCPHCGQTLIVAATDRMALAGPGFEATAPAVGAMPPNAAGSMWDSHFVTTPTRGPTPQADVVVPLLQAGITGLAAAALAAIPAMARHWSWYVPPSVGLIALSTAWMGLLLDHRKLLRKVEQYTRERRDLPPASAIPPPRPPRVEVEVVERREMGALKRISNYDIPATLDQLRAVAQGVAAGRNVSRPEFAGPGRPFTDPQFRRFQAALVDAGFLIPDPRGRRGYRVTARGQRFFEVVLQS